MPPRSRTFRLILTAVLVLSAAVAFSATGLHGRAQGPESFVGSIQQGTCERLGGTVFDLAEITLSAATHGTPDAGNPVGLPGAVPVAASGSAVDASRDILIDTPHALVVSAGNDGMVVACGNIGGVESGDTLFFGLPERNDSGYAGIGSLRPTNGDSTTIAILLAEGLTGAPAVEVSTAADATPVATPVEDGATDGDDEAAAEEVTVEMVDIDFNPNEFSIPANTDVTVHLPNLGEIVHNFHIDPLDVHSEDVEPGAETTVTINAESGDYEYYCSIPGHREAGMAGTVHVE
ncbi:MAG: cupredoxin domain-containing protein [Chloroflexi bacterium]|nr:cupredoxin domain-containing protein [Chloroflexota bacterium]